MMEKTEIRRGLFFLSTIFVLFTSPTLAQGYQVEEVTGGGTIRGSVRLDGTSATASPLEIGEFHTVCESVPDESLVVGPQGGIRYAAVTLEGVTRGKAVEREVSHEVDNVDCRFVPHVLSASVGQWLDFKNADPILHTAHARFTGQAPDFNVALTAGKVRRKPVVVPGLVEIGCELHPWMKAYVIVTEHPYHAVTDLLGHYEIADVPPGRYRMKLWHETLGVHEKEVEVEANGVTDVDFALSAPGEAGK